MPTIRDVQTAFNAGELSPLLEGRSDLAGYAAGVRTLRNLIPLKAGGVERRPGTLFVSATANEAILSRLVRFHSGQDSSYVIEFSGSGLGRIFADRGIVLAGSYDLDGVANVDTGTDELLFDTPHGYRNQQGPFRVTALDGGILPTPLSAAIDYYIDIPEPLTATAPTDIDTTADTIKVTNTFSEGMGPFQLITTGTYPGALQGLTDYYVRNPTPSTFQLATTKIGAPINITSGGTGSLTLKANDDYLRTAFRLRNAPFGGGSRINLTGTGTGFFRIAPQGVVVASFSHPYAESELDDIDYAQVGDVLYLVHPNHPPQKLIRYGSAAFHLQAVELLDGPYLLQQETEPGTVETGVTISASAATVGKARTFTASQAIFLGSDVGRVLRSSNNGTAWGWARITSVAGMAFTNADIFVVGPLAGTEEDPALELFNVTNHGFQDGEGPVRVDLNDYGLTIGTNYYVHSINANQFSLHLTRDDALADLNRVNIDAGAGAMSFISSWLDKTAHGLTDRQGPLTLTTDGTLPDGLTTGIEYWADVPDVDHIVLTLSPGGDPGLTAIELANATGTFYVNGTTVPTTSCVGDILEEFPSVAATQRWRLGAFAARSGVGWPRAVSLHEQRLVYGGTAGERQTLFFSQTGDLEYFSPDDPGNGAGATDHVLTNASAITYGLASTEADSIEWIASNRLLLIGTAGGLWTVQASTLNEALTPENVNARKQAVVGASPGKGIPVYDIVAFPDLSRTLLRAGQYNFERDAVVPADLQVLSRHLTERGNILHLAWSQVPFETLWAVRSSGELHALTFDPLQNVNAWGVHAFGAGSAGDADVESVAVSETPAGGGSQVWVVVRRTLNGTVRRFVEVFAPRFELDSTLADAHFVDAGVDVVNGSPSTTVAGLGHLEGEEVYVMADGAVHPARTVSGGSITLDVAASRVHAGLHADAYASMLPADQPGQAVSMQLAVKRVTRAVLRVVNTMNLAVGPSPTTLTELDFRRLFGDTMDAPPALRTGVVEIPAVSGYERDGVLSFGAVQPVPCTVLVAIRRIEWSTQ